MTRVFASWSGGKDGCLALHRAINRCLDAGCLLNMVSEDGIRSRSHGLRAAVIKKQAEALGIPVIQKPTADADYEAVFIETLKEFKREGIDGGVFGDIDFEPHREWDEKVCRQAGITPYLPLWQGSQPELMKEFIAAGFISVIVTVKADLLGKEFLGRTVDRQLLYYLTGSVKNVTPCGEAGEYHTLVIDGPLFKKRLEIIKSETVSRGEYHFLEILETTLKPK